MDREDVIFQQNVENIVDKDETNVENIVNRQETNVQMLRAVARSLIQNTRKRQMTVMRYINRRER